MLRAIWIRVGVSAALFCITALARSGPVAAATADEFYEASLRQGDQARDRGDRKGAMQLYQRAERTKPTAEVAVRIGDLLAWGDATKQYEIAIKRDSKVLGARSGIARVALASPSVDIAKVTALLDDEEALQPGRPEVAALRKQLQPAIEAADAQKRYQVERTAREAEAAKRDQEARTKIQSQLLRVGAIECRPIAFEELGEEIGNDVASTTASGVYVAALVKCTNVGKKTTQVDSPDFTLVDTADRRYAIDAKGSRYQAVTATADSDGEEKQRTPEHLQLHPGVSTSIVAVFDVPAAVARASGLKLDVRGSKVQLTFAVGEEPRPASANRPTRK